MNVHILVITYTLINLINSQTTDEDESIELEGEAVSEQIDYDEHEKKWVKDAVVTVGYYLRSYKFNNYDRRYFNETHNESDSNLYGYFVEPPLRYFHFEVFQNCKDDFFDCLRYLYETILDAYLQPSVDTIYIMRRKNLTFENNASNIQDIEKECNNLKKMDFDQPDPFETPIEKFQFGITASYYMCWYTMMETPELRHFAEPCDNYANCLQDDKMLTNYDIRADNTIDFQCAMYSFCPDPCCHDKKLMLNANACALNFGNPCNVFNDKTCSFNRTLNRSFISLVYNEWNVSCICQADGYRWNSRYGICIDYNECKYENPCDLESENCINTLGEYKCPCKFHYKWSEKEKKCVEEELLIRALKRFSGIDPDAGGCDCVRATIYLIGILLWLNITLL